jgi:hypothetical protein|tara:strand:- start:500 stop:631 length:132 start_codon:yes stop_codon:yes gene_type:complete
MLAGAIKDKFEHITSSPGLIPQHNKDKCIAVVQLEVTTQYFDL